MTITKEGVRVIITCFGCGMQRRDQDGVRARWRPNRVVWAEAMQEGWTAKPKDDGRDFDHFCPKCAPVPN